MRGAQVLAHRLGQLHVVGIRRDHHEVDVGGRVQASFDDGIEAELRGHQPGPGSAERPVDDRSPGVATIDAEDLARHPELEGRDARKDENGDGSQHR